MVSFVAAFAAGAFVAAGCSASHATPSTSAISQRYQAAVDPANARITTIVQQSLSYVHGSPASLISAVSPTESTLKKSVQDLNSISAPQPLHRDIQDVATALNTVIGDLTTLKTDSSTNLQPDIAILVADAGRVAAAENVVSLALALLTSGTTVPPAPLIIPTTTTTTTTTVPVAVHRATTTTSSTVAKTTTTTVRRTTTTTEPTTTVAQETTTT